ncbi:MAG: MFS transporter [Sedimentisphaerales bacterium]|nr:MFS transporter [Sedimentisphaerales bacterium]
MKLDEHKTIFSWAMYDWANSSFATTVMAVFFPIFFSEYWSTGVSENVNTNRIGNANSLAGFIIVLLAPILGAIADRGSSKKKFLLFFTFLGVVMTSCLYVVSQGDWKLAFLLYVVATIGFSGSNIFYDSLITNVASEKKMNMVSALGYSLGYLGGGTLFILNVLMVTKPQTFGFADDSEAVRFSFITVGIWWAVFTIPLMLFVKEEPRAKTMSGFSAIAGGLRQFIDTFKNIRKNRMVFIFLLAYWFYIDGVDSVIRMGVDYGKALHLETNDLIMAVLLIQFIGFPAAIAYGYLGNRIGAKRGIFLAIAIYIGITIFGAFIKTEFHFYLLAIAIGLIQGGIQSLSRSYYANLIPVEKSAEYFGFYNMMGKFAVILGPVLVGKVSLIVANATGDSMLGTRVSISSLSILLIIGGTLLCFVRPSRENKTLS